MSPGTGRTRSPMVHSPLVPALPPIGGRPPTSTILNTSTSSETRPLRARAIVSARALSWTVSRVIRGSRGKGGRRFAWESVLRRVARLSRRVRRCCVATEDLRTRKGEGIATHFCHSPSATLLVPRSIRRAFPDPMKDRRAGCENHLWCQSRPRPCGLVRHVQQQHAVTASESRVGWGDMQFALMSCLRTLA